MLHWYPFPTFYQDFLNMGCHILFRILLLDYPDFMTFATLVAILFTKNDFWQFLKCHRTFPCLMNMSNCILLFIRIDFNWFTFFRVMLSFILDLIKYLKWNELLTKGLTFLLVQRTKKIKIGGSSKTSIRAMLIHLNVFKTSLKCILPIGPHHMDNKNHNH